MIAILSDIKKTIRNNLLKKEKCENCFISKYTSWDEAKKISKGYDQPHILSKVLESALKVKDGYGIYERDGVVFHSPEYPWPFLLHFF